MSILYDWYENANDQDKPQEERRLHPRAVLNGQTDTEDLCRQISRRSTVSRADVMAVLSGLSEVMAEALSDGQRVHLDGIGYFWPTLESVTPVRHDTPQKSHNVRLKSIRFRADKDLRQQFRIEGVHQVENNGRRTTSLTTDQAMSALRTYFTDHPVLTRRDFQRLLGLSSTTARLHLQRLRQAGLLQNIGTPRQPMYILV